jgi:methionyl-tRNA formyltransferase
MTVALLLAPTYRSRALAQTLAADGFPPSPCLLLPGAEPVWDGPAEIAVPLRAGEAPRRFQPGLSLRDSLAAWGAPTATAPTADVNDPVFIDWLGGVSEQTLLYSGMAGCILRPPLLSCGKRFIHAHGGAAPRYSGSTAFYFSLLEEGTIAATVFWMDEGLDTGEVILRSSCLPPQGVEIDRIFDPVMRADALSQALRRLPERGGRSVPADAAAAVGPRRVHHVIHPVLKHLALARHGLLAPLRTPREE